MQGKVIVVTGGGSGIGRAVALLAAQRGALVCILDLDGGKATRVADEARDLGAPRAIGISCDVGIEADVKSAFTTVESNIGPVYGVFANAGVGTGGGLLHELAAEVWERVIRTNLYGVFLTSKYALRSMIAGNQGGSLVCTASPAGFIAMSAGGVPAYSASKGGVSALVRCMAIDYASYGIRCNAIVPGATETPLMWDNVPPEEVNSIREIVNSEVPLGRLAQPSEPANAVVWLLSDQSSYVTGTHLICDGGILAKGSISV